MTLSLDSNVLIDLANGDEPHVRAQLAAARRAGESLHVAAPVLHEVVYGALISARPLHQTEALQRTMMGMSLEAFTVADAYASTRVRAERRRLGRQIGRLDAMIAGQALARGWAIVTADTEDFDLIPGLTVVNWRSAPINQDR